MRPRPQARRVSNDVATWAKAETKGEQRSNGAAVRRLLRMCNVVRPTTVRCERVNPNRVIAYGRAV